MPVSANKDITVSQWLCVQETVNGGSQFGLLDRSLHITLRGDAGFSLGQRKRDLSMTAFLGGAALITVKREITRDFSQIDR